MVLGLMLALALPQDAAAANKADLRCMALLSAVTATAPKEEQAGLIAGTMFFYGKITGRSPQLNVEAEMLRMMNPASKEPDLDRDRQRCVEEITKHGNYLIAMGERLVAASKGE